MLICFKKMLWKEIGDENWGIICYNKINRIFKIYLFIFYCVIGIWVSVWWYYIYVKDIIEIMYMNIFDIRNWWMNL